MLAVPVAWAVSRTDMPWKGAHTGVTVSPDGKFLVTQMQEPALHGWRLDDMKHMRMTGYPTKVKSVSWSAKGRFLASAGANATYAWRLVTWIARPSTTPDRPAPGRSRISAASWSDWSSVVRTRNPPS